MTKWDEQVRPRHAERFRKNYVRISIVAVLAFVAGYGVIPAIQVLGN